jgi:thiol-disulfide isomerase/thioredoxin
MKTQIVIASAALWLTGIAGAQSLAGTWDASVTVNNVEIPFRLEISGEAPSIQGAFFNGEERIRSTGGRFEDGKLVLNFDQYGARLEAAWKDGGWQGSYARGANRPYPFAARLPAAPAPTADVPTIAGLWEIPAKSAKGEGSWQFVVRQSGAQVSAAILRVDGDTGTLEGRFRDGRFVLSHFDGSRPMLLEVTPLADGSLALLQNGRQKLTAIRPDAARAQGLPEPTDPAAHTSVKDASQPFHFSFPDLNGRTVADTDARFLNKVTIVAIGGSWCPNCHDEAPFLQELYRQYRARGLEVVGLFFEEADQLNNPARVRAFIRQYGLEYPMLLAGETSELRAKVPQAQNLDCWPTTFFLGRDGRVRAVHAGYAGKASGALHDELVKDTTALLEKLLDEQTVAAVR